MNDTTPIAKVLKQDGDAESQPLNSEGNPDEEGSPKWILERINFIGEKVTDVSKTFKP